MRQPNASPKALRPIFCSDTARLPAPAHFGLGDLRHSFVSRALALGESLPMIGRLLGHTQVETTARYAHLACYSVHESAARVSDSIAADIL